MLLSLLLLSPQLTPAAPARVAPSPVRIEKLTPDEQKQWKDAKAEVADAQAKADAASKAQEANKNDATTKAATDAQIARGRHQPGPPCQHRMRLLRAIAGARL
jgi:hypothetical protein